MWRCTHRRGEDSLKSQAFSGRSEKKSAPGFSRWALNLWPRRPRAAWSRCESDRCPHTERCGSSSACAHFRTLTSVCSAVPASQDAAVRRRRRRRSARELPPQGFTGNVVGHSYEWRWPSPSGLRRCAAESLLLQGTEPCSFNSNISFKRDYGMCSQFGSFTWLLCGHFWVFRSKVTVSEVY